MPTFYNSLEEINLLPGIEVAVILSTGIPVVGTLVAKLETRDKVIFPTPPLNVDADADLEPEFLIIQLTVAATFGVIVFPVGTLIAINTSQILIIGPSPI
jgi:hypothetical protein